MEESNEEYIGNQLAGETLDKSSQKVKKYLEDAPSQNLWNLKATQIYEARLLAQTCGEGVNIAIIDTGINYHHPQLKDSYRGGVNLMSNGSKEDLIDVDGHGSFVAGIITGRDIGIAPKANLYSVKISEMGFYDPRLIVNALEWCIQNRMDIINISSGTPTYIGQVHHACKMAKENGLIIVASAGNNCTGAFFPASYGEPVISVGAIDLDYNHCIFSNIWPTVDLVAPGENIFSAYSEGITNGRYRISKGTSAAAPHISGVLAIGLSLMRIRGSEAEPTKLESLLKNTAMIYLKEPLREDALSLANTYSQYYDPNKAYIREDETTVGAIYGTGLMQAKNFIELLMESQW